MPLLPRQLWKTSRQRKGHTSSRYTHRYRHPRFCLRKRQPAPRVCCYATSGECAGHVTPLSAASGASYDLPRNYESRRAARCGVLRNAPSERARAVASTLLVGAAA